MRFQLIGVNHKSAPLEVRERMAIPESRLPDTCRELAAYPGIEEGIVISTCNRVEIVTHTSNGTADLRGFLRDHFHLETTFTNSAGKMRSATCSAWLPVWIRW
jgi:glutamyl-tRNA reductase